MSTIQIKVEDEKNNNQNILDVSDSIKIIELKNKIIESLKIDSKYIDINFLLDRPIRKFGKFNLEPGILPRTFDNSKLNEFALKENSLSVGFVKDKNYHYHPQKIKKKTNRKKYVKKNNSLENNSFTFNIDEFPKLS